MLRLLNLELIGEGQHRSGWPYAINALRPLLDPDAEILLDDFVERTFLYDQKVKIDIVHTVPWVGVLHHPPDMPAWYMDHMRLQNLLNDPRFLASFKHLRMLIVMGANLHRWCQFTWPKIPCVTIKHPTGRPMLYWSPERFHDNPRQQVVQVGWFLRNMAAIYHAHVPRWLKKAHLMQHTNYWANYMLSQSKRMYAQLHPERVEYGQVSRILSIDDTDYDLLLSENVVFMEAVSAVANNTVIECIARNTPICINRHPGPEYYLGKNYPLFYNHFDEIEGLLTMDNILAAHDHLCKIDKWWMRGNMFMEQVLAACIKHIPECREAAARLQHLDLSSNI